jgi:hypothetical protein
VSRTLSTPGAGEAPAVLIAFHVEPLKASQVEGFP